MRSIDDIIHQKSFQSKLQKAYINVLFTASVLENRTAHVLRPFGISPQQFNILRILKGQDPAVVSLKAVAERMIDQNSNASRLVDKLVDKGLVNRSGCPQDRRQIDLCITGTGKALLEKANEVMTALHNEGEEVTEQEAELLSSLLDKVRNALIK
jgi:DNA-binding MarR family transcriptional regulator